MEKTSRSIRPTRETTFRLAASFIIGSVFFTVVAGAWTGPTAAPTGNNVDAPINTGSSTQMKLGTLGVGSMSVFGNTILQANSYLNFGATAGTGGYGMRDNAGTLEFKNTAGSWASLQSIVASVTGATLTKQSSAPFACDVAHDGTTAYTSLYRMCICKSSIGWVSTDDGTTACTWSCGASTGGTITTSGGYTIHTFTSSGTFTPGCAMNVQVLVVAGGGGGGQGYHGGGGGAGGMVYNASYPVTAGAMAVTVGAGGAGGSAATGYAGSDWNAVAGTGGVGHGFNGGDSIFSGITAYGGGGGGTYNTWPIIGYPGGSGGGAGCNQYVMPVAPGVSGQGNAGGGIAHYVAPYIGGGGGGAGAPGVAGCEGLTGAGGKGGAGLSSSISGSTVWYAGGGGGGAQAIYGASAAGGVGGGGAGNANTPVAGTANTGGGGGGAGASAVSGASGGSGIVIVRYPTP